ncbi:hypothetical protein M670_01116 [Schinkia azotoformans MEV2011]|uniref:Uncharacterized protein n=1 Tax=Schinkia azotoformans MEV2011 TaxID=1348973 RepID=A0A072NR01_SCHAZ|nr:hypothetical protein [Schinkia azotoformans]KEF39353.1 hypothetical protein M670_01116 [Schinkia azotoformans MEV2011]MEC1694895.1 hypothetical protein [Schinkia azotoformans]MEC1716235.1 hypothetical protein [Schinkia azotoformans]MEC1725506.1 hypothetical protein [Schinkia azotoformans]MEC1739871.1 hypothetical protein [Schinkia azotoformans]
MLISSLNQSDFKKMALLLKSVRDILSINLIKKADQDPEKLSEEEHQEIDEEYAERAKTPPYWIY